MKRFVLFVLLFTLANSLEAQENWALLKNLSENWFYYDEGWKPVTDRYEVYDAIYFQSKELSYDEKYLMISYPGEFSVFIEDRVISSAQDSLLLSYSQLNKDYAYDPQDLISVHANDLRAQYLATSIMAKYYVTDEPVVDDIINIESRPATHVESYLAILFLILLVITAIMRSNYFKAFADFYNVSKIFSGRDTDESMLRGRLFSRINFFIMIWQCFIIGLFITLMLISLDYDPDKTYNTLWGYIRLWSNITLWVILFMTIKFLLIKNFTSLYNLNNFSTPHFMSYMRMVSVIFGLAVIVAYIGKYALDWNSTYEYQRVVNGVLIMLALGIILIYLKLINNSSFKLLHLFSYLCATEILPFVVVLKLSINHSI